MNHWGNKRLFSNSLQRTSEYLCISSTHMQTLTQTHAYRHDIRTLWEADSYLFFYHFIHLKLSSIYLHPLQFPSVYFQPLCTQDSAHFFCNRSQWKVESGKRRWVQPVHQRFKGLIIAFSTTSSSWSFFKITSDIRFQLLSKKHVLSFI